MSGRTFLRFYRWNDWFFRVGGRGVSVQPLKGHVVLFTERYGYQRAWHVFGLCIKPLGWREVAADVRKKWPACDAWIPGRGWEKDETTGVSVDELLSPESDAITHSGKGDG